jgi:hypothetical protein
MNSLRQFGFLSPEIVVGIEYEIGDSLHARDDLK